MNSNELRQAFLDYFQHQDHTLVRGSSLVPGNDQTLLFTNAGMVQFKDVFLGKEKSPYARATTVQRCVRAGGKHNDLENVGYTARHHTFFEMLGNFSFGDYFKREAISYAWKFITEVLKIPSSKLWVTVYKDDDEATDIWLKEMKIDANRFSRCDEDNFWTMGDVGPCGPCSEIFYDHGESIPGGPPGSPEGEGDRYVEIWNLVFMQFNRAADGSITPLPKPSVDTGMGFERMAAVMQGVHNNYDIDIFRHLIRAVADLIEGAEQNPTSMRVIADHIRSTAFLITDGVMPSNEGRGYVLRRIIRRAIRHGHKLGLREPFFYRLAEPLVSEMGWAYPELVKAKAVVEKVLKHEEEQFAQTLDQGMKMLETCLQSLHGNVIPGEILFRLYDTYGFPPDLTGDIARERGLSLDYPGFEVEMEKQRQKSQASSQFSINYQQNLSISGDTIFTGYERLNDEAIIIALLQKGKMIQTLNKGETGAVILDRTPFYAESGGQVGDKGKLFFEEGVFNVLDTRKQGAVFIHEGRMESGNLTVGMKVSAEVDASRHAIVLNHSATHLLHAALRRLIGEHVTQKGSLVEADRLRFDFSHFASLTSFEIKSVERLVNQQIRANLPCYTNFMSIEESKKTGAIALFDEKYGDQVRVLNMGEFSVELCGGTHVSNTGEIGVFKIISETGIAAGVRRIEAVTGEKALDWVEGLNNELNVVTDLLKTNREEIIPKLRQLLEQNRAQEKMLSKLKQEALNSWVDALIHRAEKINDITIIVAHVVEANNEELRLLVDQLKMRCSRLIILLTGRIDSSPKNSESFPLLVAVTDNVLKIKSKDLFAFAAQQVGGKGGGRSDLIQGRGVMRDQIDIMLESTKKWIEKNILS